MKLAALLRGKRGISIVEEICAVLILAVAVVALLSTIGFAGGTVSKGNVADRAAAEAQRIADTLIDGLSSAKTADDPALDSTLEEATGARKVGDFSASFGDGGQFRLEPTGTDGIAGYAITVRVYYNNGKSYAELQAFAADTEGAFNG